MRLAIFRGGSPFISFNCRPVSQSPGAHFPPLYADLEPELTVTILMPPCPKHITDVLITNTFGLLIAC